MREGGIPGWHDGVEEGGAFRLGCAGGVEEVLEEGGSWGCQLSRLSRLSRLELNREEQLNDTYRRGDAYSTTIQSLPSYVCMYVCT